MSGRSRLAGEYIATLGVLVVMGVNAVRAAPTPAQDCLNNQKLIVSALWAHALESKIPPEHAVLLTNLSVYFKDNRIPSCPLGGTYPPVLAVTREPLDVDQAPICSLGSPEQHLQWANKRWGSGVVQRARWLVVVVAIVIIPPLLLAWRRRLARGGEPPSDVGD